MGSESKVQGETPVVVVARPCVSPSCNCQGQSNCSRELKNPGFTLAQWDELNGGNGVRNAQSSRPFDLSTMAQRAGLSREQLLHKMMQEMQPHWRNRWCGGGLCACMGAANCSGQLGAAGFTREEWQAYCDKNGIAPPDYAAAEKQLHETLRKIFGGERISTE